MEVFLHGITTLKSEIYERAEAYGVERAQTEQQHEDRYWPYYEVLFCRVISVKREVYQLLAEREQSDEREHKCDDERGIELWSLCPCKRLEIKGEQSCDECPGVIEVLDAEDSPAHHGDNEGDDDTRHLADLLVESVQSHAFKYEPHAMVGAPDDEVPVGAMPEA